jgi:hypothetical protein
MLTPNNPALYLSGIPLEKAVTWLHKVMGLGGIYEHNDFNPRIYPNEKSHIVDGEIKQIALYECTNPKETTFLNDEIMANKLNYFWRKDPEHLQMWVLVVSYANFSDYIKQLINEYGIVLIELKETATESNFKSYCKHLIHSRLYALLKRLSNLKPKSPFFSGLSKLSVTTLTQYQSKSNNNNKHNNKHYLHRTTTTDDDKDYKEWLIWLHTPVVPSNIDWLRYRRDVEDVDMN